MGYGALLLSALGLWFIGFRQAGSFDAFITRQDFMGIYIGPRLLVIGQGAELYDIATQFRLQQSLTDPYSIVHTLYHTYPAWVALALAPLAALPFGAAFITWAGLNTAAYAVVAGRLMRAAAGLRVERYLLLLVALGFMPFWYALWQGQTPIIVCLGLAGAMLSLRAGRDDRAGAWLLLGLIKPQLIAVPLLALLVARRWRALVTFSVGALAVFLTSLVALGNWVPDYLSLLTAYVQTGENVGDDVDIMHNWRALIHRLLGEDAGPLGTGLVSGLTVLSLALVVAICWPRSRTNGHLWDARFSVAILVGLLVNPHLYLHDAVIAIVPGFVLWRAAAGANTRLRLLRYILAAGPFVARIAVSWAPPVVEIGSWYLVALLTAIFWAWPLLTQEPEAPETAMRQPHRDPAIP